MKIKNKKTNLLLFFIILVAAILRFANYFERLNFSVDQGRDALIGLESLNLHKLPLLGPPSSSWGFNFGPLYYYVISLFTLLIPGIFSPWIGFTFLSVFSVFLAFKIGCLSGNKQFGFILSLVTAVSFGEIANSTNLLNTALVSFAVFLAFYGVSAYYQSQKYYFLILTGFAIALAIQSHLQAAPISALLLSPLVLCIDKKIIKKIKSLSYTILGFALGMLPLIVFELQHNFAWSKSLIDYMTFGQYRFYVPIRWLTDITVFWPGRFGDVLWGNSSLGLFVAIPIVLILSFYLFKKKLDRISLLVLFVFVLEILSIRNYRGPRSPEYLIFTQFFIIYLFSLAVSLIAEGRNKLINTVILSIIAISGIYSNLPQLSLHTHSGETIKILNFVKNREQQQVSFYVLAGSFENANTLYYLLSRSGLISDNGYPIAICDNGADYGKVPDRCPASHRLYSTGRFVLFDYGESVRTDFKGLEVSTIDPLILYKRTYNNYESIKY